MKCSDCVYKKTFSICGNDNSPFYNKEVRPTQSCGFFKENPAQIHFSDGLKNILSDNIEGAVNQFELALEGGLPEDDEVLARAHLGGAYPNLDKWDDGYKHIEKAIMLDSQEKLNVFKGHEMDRLSTFCQFSVICSLKSREIKEKSGIDSAISFIQEKLKLVEYLPGKYMPGLHYELSTLYLDKADEKDEVGEDVRLELDLATSSLKNCLEAEYDENNDMQLEYKQMAEQALQNIENMKTSEAPKVKKGPCFIASTVYGSPYAPEVFYLKNYRDTQLSKNVIGRWVIKKYYEISPFFASILKKSEVFKKLTIITILNPIIKIIKSRSFIKEKKWLKSK